MNNFIIKFLPLSLSVLAAMQLTNDCNIVKWDISYPWSDPVNLPLKQSLLSWKIWFPSYSTHWKPLESHFDKQNQKCNSASRSSQKRHMNEHLTPFPLIFAFRWSLKALRFRKKKLSLTFFFFKPRDTQRKCAKNVSLFSALNHFHSSYRHKSWRFTVIAHVTAQIWQESMKEKW